MSGPMMERMPPLADAVDRAIEPACLDCGALLYGPFCSQCGQRDRDPDPTLRELLAEGWDAFLNVDGRLVTSLRTLVLRPGRLTAEYLAGCRTRYFAPLRLYLVCSLAFFVVTALVPQRRGEPSVFGPGARPDTAARQARDRAYADSVRVEREPRRRARLIAHGIVPPAAALDSGLIRRADSIRIAESMSRRALIPRALRPRVERGLLRIATHGIPDLDFRTQMPRLMFVLMPLLAVLLAICYRSRRRRYPAHLIVALHLHAFMFVSFTLDRVTNVIPDWRMRSAVALPFFLWTFAYMPMALRTVYGGRWSLAIVRCVALVVGYLAMMGAVVLTTEIMMAFVG